MALVWLGEVESVGIIHRPPLSASHAPEGDVLSSRLLSMPYALSRCSRQPARVSSALFRAARTQTDEGLP